MPAARVSAGRGLRWCAIGAPPQFKRRKDSELPVQFLLFKTIVGALPSPPVWAGVTVRLYSARVVSKFRRAERTFRMSSMTSYAPVVAMSKKALCF
eukprot:3041936-Rhodomonas_salina.1